MIVFDETCTDRVVGGDLPGALVKEIHQNSYDTFEDAVGASWYTAFGSTFESHAERATNELARTLLNGLGYEASMFSWADQHEAFVDQSEWIGALSAYTDAYDEIRSSIASFAQELFVVDSVGAFARSAVAAAAVGGYENLAEQLFAPSFIDAIEATTLVIDGFRPGVSDAPDPTDPERLWARWLSNAEPLFFLLNLHDRANGHHSSIVRWVRLSKSGCLRLEDSEPDGPLRPFRSIAEATVGHFPHAPPHSLPCGVTS